MGPPQYIANEIEERTFVSSHDGEPQTFLIKDFRSEPVADGKPLVVYLHGAESHQAQGMTAGIYGNAFGRLAKILKGREAVYVCPEYRGNSWMGPAAESDLREILRILKEEFRPTSVLLMGGSMGGTSSLIFASRNPLEIDGVLAFCPATDVGEVFDRDKRFQADLIKSYGGTPSENPEEYRQRSSRYAATRLAGLPIVLVHGRGDLSIPVHHSRLLAAELRQAGARFHYEEIKGGHDSPLDLALDDFFSFLDLGPPSRDEPKKNSSTIYTDPIL